MISFHCFNLLKGPWRVLEVCCSLCMNCCGIVGSGSCSSTFVRNNMLMCLLVAIAICSISSGMRTLPMLWNALTSMMRQTMTMSQIHAQATGNFNPPPHFVLDAAGGKHNMHDGRSLTLACSGGMPLYGSLAQPGRGLSRCIQLKDVL